MSANNVLEKKRNNFFFNSEIKTLKSALCLLMYKTSVHMDQFLISHNHHNKNDNFWP